MNFFYSRFPVKSLKMCIIEGIVIPRVVTAVIEWSPLNYALHCVVDLLPNQFGKGSSTPIHQIKGPTLHTI